MQVRILKVGVVAMGACLASVAHADVKDACMQAGGEAAIAACSEWLKASPNEPEAYYWRGIEQADHGRYDPAIIDYTRAIELDPAYVDALKARAFAYNAIGKADAARADLRLADTLRPNDPDIQRGLRNYGSNKP